MKNRFFTPEFEPLLPESMTAIPAIPASAQILTERKPLRCKGMVINMKDNRPLTDEESRAIEVAYENCLYALKRTIRNYFDKPELCEDCEQETLLWAARYIDSFMASANREGWLIKASKNIAK